MITHKDRDLSLSLRRLRVLSPSGFVISAGEYDNRRGEAMPSRKLMERFGDWSGVAKAAGRLVSEPPPPVKPRRYVGLPQRWGSSYWWAGVRMAENPPKGERLA